MSLSDLEERIRRLEESRHRNVGELNAQRTLLLSAWMTLIARSSEPPEKVIEQLRQDWLPPYDGPIRRFQGADAADLEAISQEYEKQIEDLFFLLEQAVLNQGK